MKKVLIITYYWPPAGGPGVQRVLKFVKYLPRLGWEPVVLTVAGGSYPARDDSLEKDIPDVCSVYRTKIWEPFGLFKRFTGKGTEKSFPIHLLERSSHESLTTALARFIRLNFFLPDARNGWIRYMVKEGIKIIEKHGPDLIFSCSPPHSLQMGALKLARLSGIKWVADFRDRWSEYFILRNQKILPTSRLLQKKMERKVVEKANFITCVSQGVMASLNRGRSDIKCQIIYNGFDEEDFTGIARKLSDKYRITYAGHLRKSQNPVSLFRALKRINPDILADMEMNFYGPVHQDIHALLKKFDLQHRVNIHPYKPHDMITEIMVNSDLLILLIIDSENNRGIISGKIFEYLRSGNFILGIGPQDGEAAEILRSTSCGEMYDYADDIYEVIMDHYNRWKAGKCHASREKEIRDYSRENQTRRLAKIFEQLTA